MSGGRPWTKCPHDNVVFCPLYHAAHGGLGGSCDDGRLAEGGCAVDRGLDYREGLARLNDDGRRVAAQLRFLEEAERCAGQRRRNMRLLGLH